MAITEKSKPLEFTCDMSELYEGAPELVRYEISHDPNETFPLTIVSATGEYIRCPVELLTEIVSFLQQKGVLAAPQQANSTFSPTSSAPQAAPAVPSRAQGETIPLPQIQRKAAPHQGGQVYIPPPLPEASLQAIPIASFDVGVRPSMPASIEVESMAEEVQLPNVPVPDVMPPSRPQPTEQELAEMKRRPVVKFSEAGKKDGMIAQQEAAQLRRAMSGGGKSIKRLGD